MNKLIGLLCVVIIGCGASEGTETGPCYPNGTCNDGLVCASDVCVIWPPDGGVPDGGVPDGGVPDGGFPEDSMSIDSGVLPDAAPALVCNDDLAVEPNDTIGMALLSPIPDLRDDYALIGLALCPTTDIDMISFGVVEPGKDLRMEIRFRSMYGSLQLDLLDDTGATIASGVSIGPDGSDPTLEVVQLELLDLPLGVYYAQVSSSMGIENNYDIQIVTYGP